MTSHAGSAGDPAWKTIPAVLVGAGVSWGALSYVTLTIGVLADGYGFSLGQAAALATLELGMMALATASGGLALRTLSVRQLAVLGAVVGATGNLTTALAADLPLVAVLRAVSGAGLGWLSAGLNTSISRTRDPERLFTQANFGCITLAALFFALMPSIYDHGHFRLYFVAYGGLCAGCAAFMGWLPAGIASRESVQAARRVTARGTGVVLAVIAIWLSYSAVWALCERLGRDIGMTETAVGHVLGIGTLAGLAGGAAAAWLAGRISQPIPMIVTSMFCGLCYIVLTLFETPTVYTWVLILWGVAFCPILAYAFAIGTAVDSSGALGRFIMAATALSTAAGPVVGARAHELYGYRGVGLLTFTGTLLGCIMFAVVMPGRRQMVSHSVSRS